MTDLYKPQSGTSDAIPPHSGAITSQSGYSDSEKQAPSPSEPTPEAKKHKSKARSALMLLLKIGVTVGLMAFLFRGVDKQKLLNTIQNASLTPIFFAIVMVVINNIFGAFRWQALLRTRGCNPSLFLLTRLYMIGWFYGNFLPTQIGGDVARGIYLNRTHPGYVKDNIMAMLVERIMGFLGLNALTLSGLAIAGARIDTWLWTLSLCLAAFCLFSVVMLFYAPYEIILEKMLKRFMPSKASKLANILGAAKMYNKPRLLGTVLFNSIMLQMTTVLPLYMIGLAINAKADVYHLLIIVPLSLLSGMLPFTINGYGLRENIMSDMLAGEAHIDPSKAVALAFMFGMLLLARALIGGIFLLMEPKHNEDASRDAEAEQILEADN